MNSKILVIVGPTASGKSALAVLLARKLGGEIISADSRQVYKGLDIGTGKITRREMKGVPHHLLDVVSPKKTFTAHDFIQQGRAAITNIAARGRLPIVVGGTGFYIDALVGRIALPDVPPNKRLRAALEKKSAAQLFALLKRKDPRRAREIDRHNTRRLIRALEIVHTLGRIPRPGKNPALYKAVWIGIRLPETELKTRIAKRFTARMKQGMIAEAKRLRKSGLSYKRMIELGLEYRSLARYLQGKIPREKLDEEIIRGNLNYAKRQMMYWKRNPEIRWFPTAEKALDHFLKTNKKRGVASGS